MKWIILNNIKHLEQYVYHYLKKSNNPKDHNIETLHFYYRTPEDFSFFKPDRALLISDKIGDRETFFLELANKNNIYTSLITENLELINDKISSIFYVREKENFLDQRSVKSSDFLDQRSVKSSDFLDINHESYNYNYTNMHLALPKMFNWIKKKKKGKYNFLNKEICDIDQEKDKDYITPSEGIEIEEEIIDLKLKKKVNIYMPSYYRFDKTKQSILDILEISKESMHDIMIYIGDNNTKIHEMRDWLLDLDKKEEIIKVYFSDNNIGKANIINYMNLEVARKDYNYLFSIDSDMCRDTTNNKKEGNIFDKMIEILEMGNNVGLVASNQGELSQHWYGRTVFPSKIRGFNLGFTNNGIGISGGCILMKKRDWDTVGGYKKDHDIYTGDDSILTYNVFRILGKVAVIAHDYYLKHPKIEEDEKGYTEWKMESWKRDNINFIKDNYKGSNTKGYYD